MKNLITLLLLIVLSVAAVTTVYAEGDLPNGNRNCPQGQSCLIAPPIGTEETETSVLMLIKEEIQDLIFSYF